MNIGIRLHDAAGATLEEKLRNAHEQGFSCVQAAFQYLLPGFQMQHAPELLTPQLAGELKALLARYDMQLAVLGCYLNLGTPDPDALKQNIATYEAYLRFAPLVGAKVVGTETGAPNVDYHTEPACYTEESLSLFIERLRPLVDCAVHEGSVLAIEPVCRHIMSSTERTQRVLSCYPTPHLAAILDAVNLLNPDDCPKAGELFDEAIRGFGDRVQVLHMKDFLPPAGGGDVRSLACGLGQMDYTPLIRFAAAHPGIPMTLEDTTPNNSRQARLFLEEKAQFLSGGDQT